MYKLILILLVVLIVIYFINYTEVEYFNIKADSEKSSFFNLEKDIRDMKPIGWFDANSYNSGSNKWISKVGNSSFDTKNITKNITNSLFPYISGRTDSTLTNIPWPGENQPYTFIHLAKYNGETRQRIWNGTSGDWLSGFWSNSVGFFHEGWINVDGIGINASNGGIDWLLSVDMNDFARVNQGVWSATGPSYSPVSIGVNIGMFNEPSDFAIAEFIIFNKKLTDVEYIKVENYLLKKYGLFGTVIDNLTKDALQKAAEVSADADAAATAAKEAICNYQLQDPDINNCIWMNGTSVDNKSIAFDNNSTNMKKDVYLKYKSPNTYIMSSDNQDARYYNGPITDYNPCNWNTYTMIPDKETYITYDKCEADKIAAAATKETICNYQLQDLDSYNCIGINGAFVNKKSVAFDNNSSNMKKDVYLKYEDPNTYIVSADNKDVRSYKGPITNYKPCDWNNYSTVQSDREKEKYKTYNKCEADRIASAATKKAICNYQSRDPDSKNCIGMNGAFVNKKSIAYDTNANIIKDVYLKYEEPNTYIMPYDNQDPRYYKGPISNYKPCDWNTYASVQPDSEKLKYKTYDKCEADRKVTATKAPVPTATVVKAPTAAVVRTSTATATVVRAPTAAVVRTPTATVVRAPTATVVKAPVPTVPAAKAPTAAVVPKTK
jgi:hypothetical protein